MIASVPEGHPSIKFRPGRFGVTPYVRIVQPPPGVDSTGPMFRRGVARQGQLPISAVNVGPSPVSYTHLDVYKRQMMGHATAGMVERYQHATRASRSRLAENMSKLAEV